MKIPGIRSTSTQTSQRAKRTADAGGARFSEHLSRARAAEEEGEPAAGVSGVVPATWVFATQEVDDDAERSSRRQFARRGEDILDHLEEIRRDILLGAVPRDRLEKLAQSLRQRRAAVNDPRLIEILDEIELRAAVEIAKLTRGV